MSELQSRVANFEEDVALTHELVHGDDATKVATDNGPLRTFAHLQKDLENDLSAAAAITETGQNRTAAETARVGAEDAKVAADLARDAAQLSAGIYVDIATGLAATSAGEYFSVETSNTSEYLALYLNNAGTAELAGSYPSLAALEAAHQTIAAAQSAQVQMATNMIRTQTIIAEHHAFS